MFSKRIITTIILILSAECRTTKEYSENSPFTILYKELDITKLTSIITDAIYSTSDFNIGIKEVATNIKLNSEDVYEAMVKLGVTFKNFKTFLISYDFNFDLFTKLGFKVRTIYANLLKRVNSQELWNLLKLFNINESDFVKYYVYGNERKFFETVSNGDFSQNNFIYLLEILNLTNFLDACKFLQINKRFVLNFEKYVEKDFRNFILNLGVTKSNFVSAINILKFRDDLLELEIFKKIFKEEVFLGTIVNENRIITSSDYLKPQWINPYSKLYATSIDGIIIYELMINLQLNNASILLINNKSIDSTIILTDNFTIQNYKDCYMISEINEKFEKQYSDPEIKGNLFLIPKNTKIRGNSDKIIKGAPLICSNKLIGLYYNDNCNQIIFSKVIDVDFYNINRAPEYNNYSLLTTIYKQCTENDECRSFEENSSFTILYKKLDYTKLSSILSDVIFSTSEDFYDLNIRINEVITNLKVYSTDLDEAIVKLGIYFDDFEKFLILHDFNFDLFTRLGFNVRNIYAKVLKQLTSQELWNLLKVLEIDQSSFVSYYVYGNERKFYETVSKGNLNQNNVIYLLQKLNLPNISDLIKFLEIDEIFVHNFEKYVEEDFGNLILNLGVTKCNFISAINGLEIRTDDFMNFKIFKDIEAILKTQIYFGTILGENLIITSSKYLKPQWINCYSKFYANGVKYELMKAKANQINNSVKPSINLSDDFNIQDCYIVTKNNKEFHKRYCRPDIRKDFFIIPKREHIGNSDQLIIGSPLVCTNKILALYYEDNKNELIFMRIPNFEISTSKVTLRNPESTSYKPFFDIVSKMIKNTNIDIDNYSNVTPNITSYRTDGSKSTSYIDSTTSEMNVSTNYYKTNIEVIDNTTSKIVASTIYSTLEQVSNIIPEIIESTISYRPLTNSSIITSKLISYKPFIDHSSSKRTSEITESTYYYRNDIDNVSNTTPETNISNSHKPSVDNSTKTTSQFIDSTNYKPLVNNNTNSSFEMINSTKNYITDVDVEINDSTSRSFSTDNSYKITTAVIKSTSNRPPIKNDLKTTPEIIESTTYISITKKGSDIIKEITSYMSPNENDFKVTPEMVKSTQFEDNSNITSEVLDSTSYRPPVDNDPKTTPENASYIERDSSITNDVIESTSYKYFIDRNSTNSFPSEMVMSTVIDYEFKISSKIVDSTNHISSTDIRSKITNDITESTGQASGSTIAEIVLSTDVSRSNIEKESNITLEIIESTSHLQSIDNGTQITSEGNVVATFMENNSFNIRAEIIESTSTDDTDNVSEVMYEIIKGSSTNQPFIEISSTNASEVIENTSYRQLITNGIDSTSYPPYIDQTFSTTRERVETAKTTIKPANVDTESEESYLKKSMYYISNGVQYIFSFFSNIF